MIATIYLGRPKLSFDSQLLSLVIFVAIGCSVMTAEFRSQSLNISWGVGLSWLSWVLTIPVFAINSALTVIALRNHREKRKQKKVTKDRKSSRTAYKNSRNPKRVPDSKRTTSLSELSAESKESTVVTETAEVSEIETVPFDDDDKPCSSGSLAQKVGMMRKTSVIEHGEVNGTYSDDE